MERFEYLWENFLQDRLSREERLEIIDLLKHKHPRVERSIEELLHTKGLPNLGSQTQSETLLQRILHRKRTWKQSFIYRILHQSSSKVAAACVLTSSLIGLGIYLNQRSINSKRINTKTETRKQVNDIPAGSNKATLIFADGSQILLDETGIGTIANQGGSSVVKMDSGQVGYVHKPQQSALTVYNTLKTPRGGQYQIVLPDGSKVWLNAESSLRFPTSFTEAKRIVELKGEAYFEVAKKKDNPFLVKTGRMDVSVLGTKFNINAYENEQISTASLLEGSVSVALAGVRPTIVLQPGQEATIDRNREMKTNSGVDIDEAIAWQKGYFHFDDLNITAIMRQLSRWYDVEIVFKDPGNALRNRHFTGYISRQVGITKVLEMLNETGGIRYNIVDHQKIILMP